MQHYATKVFTGKLWRKISHWNLPFLPSKQVSTNTSAKNVVNCPLFFWDRVKLILKINRGGDSLQISSYKLLEVKMKQIEARIMEDSTDACLICGFDFTQNCKHSLQMLLLGTGKQTKKGADNWRTGNAFWWSWLLFYNVVRFLVWALFGVQVQKDIHTCV